MSERELAKKIQEESYLSYFLAAYRRATGENFGDVQPSETPDFLARDRRRQIVGIELTQVKFRPVDMSQRRIVDGQEWADHNDAHWRIVELVDAKEQKLPNWPACTRRMLVIQLADIPLADLLPTITTDKPEPGGFTEIWLADFTMLDTFSGCDLYPIVHRRLEGLFDVASRDRKPYGYQDCVGRGAAHDPAPGSLILTLRSCRARRPVNGLPASSAPPALALRHGSPVARLPDGDRPAPPPGPPLPRQ